MYKIIFKGDIEPEYVDNQIGMRLYADWKHNRLPPKVEIRDGFAIESSSIKAIGAGYSSPDRSQARDRGIAHMEDVEREYKAERARRLASTIQDRANDLALARIVWHAHTRTYSIPREIAEKMIEAQLRFFEANPHRTIADPTCYRTIIETNAPQYRRDGSPIMSSFMAYCAMSLAERICLTDKSFVRTR